MSNPRHTRNLSEGLYESYRSNGSVKQPVDVISGLFYDWFFELITLTEKYFGGWEDRTPDPWMSCPWLYH